MYMFNHVMMDTAFTGRSRGLHRADRPLGELVLQRLTGLRAGRLDGVPLEHRPAGDLSDCRKLYVGRVGEQPTHRIVYRRHGNGVVEVLTVVAVGEREGLAVYLAALGRLSGEAAREVPRPRRVRGEDD